MTDLISRADAIEAVAEEWLSEASAESPYVNDDDIGAYRTLAENLFKDVPSADAVQGWIPCSERLPSEDGSYLVTSSFGKVYTAHFYSEHGRWQYNRRGLIEAWMPPPKPYREDGEEE